MVRVRSKPSVTATNAIVWAVQQTGVDPSRADASAYERVVVQPANPPGLGHGGRRDRRRHHRFHHRAGRAMPAPVPVLGGATGAIVGSAADANAQAQAQHDPSSRSIKAAAAGRARADSYRRAIGACLTGTRLYRHLRRGHAMNQTLKIAAVVGVMLLWRVQASTLRAADEHDRGRAEPRPEARGPGPERGGPRPGAARPAFDGRGQVLDSRYNHGRYYPPLGTVRPFLAGWVSALLSRRQSLLFQRRHLVCAARTGLRRGRVRRRVW